MTTRGERIMRRNARHTLSYSLLFVLLAVPLAPRLAGAQAPPPWAAPLQLHSDATLYEATENMKLKGKVELGGQTFPRFRKATSELMGVARRGSPLCPDWVPGTGNCTINVTGHDSVDLTTGLGSLHGTFTTLVQGDNLVDSPEFVVMKGKFKGTIDFRPALDPIHPLPLGTVYNAHLAVDGIGSFPFTGTFRQPFDIGYGPMYWTDSGPVFVQPNEFALSFPAVRFEITFPK